MNTPDETPTAPTKPVCRHCSSDDTSRDANAAWCVDSQAWTLVCTYDNTTSQTCCRDADDLTDWIPVTAVSMLQRSAAVTAKP